jgi:hypothetical protein
VIMRELKRALGGYGVGVVPIFIVPGPPRLSCNYLKTLLIERFSALAGAAWQAIPRLVDPPPSVPSRHFLERADCESLRVCNSAHRRRRAFALAILMDRFRSMRMGIKTS